jgi:hypothetical protein
MADAVVIIPCASLNDVTTHHDRIKDDKLAKVFNSGCFAVYTVSVSSGEAYISIFRPSKDV